MSLRVKKVMAWRVISFTVSMIINYFVFNDWDTSFWFTCFIMALFTVMHYYFEIGWEHYVEKVEAS